MVASQVHTILPQSQKDTYGGSGAEIVDLKMELSGRMLAPNTTILTGEVLFEKTTATAFAAAGTDDAYYDSKIGAHAFIQNINLDFDSLGQVSSINEYPRFVKHHRVNNASLPRLASESNFTLELCASEDKQTQLILPGPDPAAGRLKYSFAIKPLFPLNMMSGPLRDLYGQIKVSLTLNDNAAVLYGGAVVATSKYTITNLQMHYTTLEDDGSPAVQSLPTVNSATHTINAGTDNFSINMARPAYAAIGSYIPVAEVNQTAYNNYRFANPDITRLVWSFNDATNQIITYNLTNDQEILWNSLEALGQKRTCLYNLPTLNATTLDDEYTIGCNFGRMINFQRQKLGVQTVATKPSSTAKYFLYLFFLGEVALK